jgi:hypothetical protein
MTTLESVFLDEYKRLNAVCSDMFHDKNGVTAYLNYMDTVPNAARQGISTWSYDRSTLLRLRHVRNQIAHSTESSSCTEEDLNKLKNFYDRLLHGEDALSEYTQLRATRRPRQPKQEKQQGPIKGKRRSKERIQLMFLAFFLVIFILLSYIAFLLLSHI